MQEVPASVKERYVIVKDLLGNPAKKYMLLYSLLKKIDKAEYSVHEEFRKNVTLRLKGVKTMDIKVENLYNYLEITKEFVSYMKGLMKK